MYIVRLENSQHLTAALAIVEGQQKRLEEQEKASIVLMAVVDRSM